MLRRIPKLVLVASLTSVVAGPSAASAATACSTAPGVGAGDQYCEAVPSGDGGRDTAGGGSDRPGVSASARSRLSETKDGRAVLGVTGMSPGRQSGANERDSATDDSAASRADSRDDELAAGADARSTADPDVPSNSPLRAVGSAVTNGSTVGSGFVWTLLVLTAAGAVVGLRRRIGWTSGPVKDDAASS